MKEFARWLWRKNRTETHQLLDLDIETVTDKTKRVRFQQDELDRLIQTAISSAKTVDGYDGEMRAWLYILSVQTGYRRKELGAVTPESFDFDGDPPTLSVRVGQTKNQKAATQPFRTEIVPALKEFLAGKQGPIFPNLRKLEPPKTSNMIDLDMREAGIPKLTQDGKRDFHSLKHTFTSMFAASGLPITEVRDLSRHSDIRTTAGYMQADAGVAKRAAAVLPNLPVPGGSTP